MTWGNFQLLTLFIMYLIAAFERARMTKKWPEMFPWYHISVALCLVSAGNLVWLTTMKIPTETWLFVSRCIQIAVVPVIYIWPSVIGARYKEELARKVAEQLGES